MCFGKREKQAAEVVVKKKKKNPFPVSFAPTLFIHILTATHLSSDPCKVNYIVPCHEFPVRGENDFLLSDFFTHGSVLDV